MAKRGLALSIFAALNVGLAVFNLIQSHTTDRYIYFGWRPDGVVEVTVLELAISLFYLIFALAIWQMRRWALPMSYVYAALVTLNLIDLVFSRNAFSLPLIVAMIFAFMIACGPAILLYRRKAFLVPQNKTLAN